MGFVMWAVAYVALGVSFALGIVVGRVGRRPRRRARQPVRRVLATGTFHNPNWFLAHAVPLTKSGVEAVYFICDEVPADIEGVQFLCPPRWLAKTTGRALSKFIWAIVCTRRYAPDVCMGYHIFPNGLIALVVARLFGRIAGYQMTGGPMEIVGGGSKHENRLMMKLKRPSKLIENLAVGLIRQFDLVVVRGNEARRFLTDRGVSSPIAIIPGGIAPDRFQGGSANTDRPYDMVFVGRLADIKQPMQFIEVVGRVHEQVPSVRAVVVGEGPLMGPMRERARTLGVAECVAFRGKIKDVENVLARSKVFMLCSRSEGLSIAMSEAMLAGVVPVVVNVGELGDLVRPGENGFLVTPNDLDEYALSIMALLNDPSRRARYSQAAIRAVEQHNTVLQVAAKWQNAFARVAGMADGRTIEKGPV